MPHWRGKRIKRKEALDGGGDAMDLLTTPALTDLDEIGVYLLVIVAVVVTVLVVIPLLLFGIELIILALVVAAGIVGRTLLGRPWAIQARPTDGSAAALTWRVAGWRRSRYLITEVAASLESGKALPASS